MVAFGPVLTGVATQSPFSSPNDVASLSAPFWHLVALFTISLMTSLSALTTALWHLRFRLVAAEIGRSLEGGATALNRAEQHAGR